MRRGTRFSVLVFLIPWFVCLQTFAADGPDAAWLQRLCDIVAVGQSGNWAKAEQELEMAINLHPNSTEARELHTAAVRLAAIEAYERGKLDESIERWDRLIAGSPRDKSLFQCRSACWFGKAELGKAIEDLTTVVQLDSKDPSPLMLRAQCYMATSKHDAALRDLMAADEISPDVLKTNFAIVWLLATCPDGAVRNGAKALERGQAFVKNTRIEERRIARPLAAAYAEVGRFDDAIRTQKLAVLDSGGSGPDTLFDQLLLSVYSSKQPFHGAGPLWKLAPAPAAK